MSLKSLTSLAEGHNYCWMSSQANNQQKQSCWRSPEGSADHSLGIKVTAAASVKVTRRWRSLHRAAEPPTMERFLLLRHYVRQLAPWGCRSREHFQHEGQRQGEGHCKPKTSTAAGTKSMEGQSGGLSKVSQVSVRHLSIVASIWIPEPLLEM